MDCGPFRRPSPSQWPLAITVSRAAIHWLLLEESRGRGVCRKLARASFEDARAATASTTAPSRPRPPEPQAPAAARAGRDTRAQPLDDCDPRSTCSSPARCAAAEPRVAPASGAGDPLETPPSRHSPGPPLAPAAPRPVTPAGGGWRPPWRAASINVGSGSAWSGQMAHDTLRAASSRGVGSGSRIRAECRCRTALPQHSPARPAPRNRGYRAE
jgi:hypothetical protein